MDIINIKDKQFGTFITEEQILKEVSRVAAQINNDLEGKNPLFLAVLNGSFMFMSDLMKRVNIVSELTFVKMSSYNGTDSTGKVRELLGLNEDITGRTVVVVEDIVDTGLTMKKMLQLLTDKGAADIKVATLLAKPGKLQVDLKLDYVAMTIPNDFIVGYGLDYDGYGRNYRDIYKVIE